MEVEDGSWEIGSAGVRSHWHGLRCLEVVFDEVPSPRLFRWLAQAVAELRRSGLADGAVSSYCSLAVYWDSLPGRGVEQLVLEKLGGLGSMTAPTDSGEHVIPARYCGEDLGRVAAGSGLSETEVVEVHAGAEYTVAAVGFLPNFGYLWGLDERLVTPRLSTPRARVPVGALGIGGSQTGIYPQSSPGGWNLIGQVEEKVCGEVCPELRVGDKVRFEVTG